MSLYDDIITDVGSENTGGWSSKSSSIKLLHEHLQVKRNIVKNNQKFVGNFNRTSVVDEIVSPTHIGGSQNNISAKGSSLLGGDWDISEEYDPGRPNDYEKLIKEKTKTRDSHQIVATRSLGLDYDDDDDIEENKFINTRFKSKPSVAIAPPSSLSENIEKNSSATNNFEVSSVAAKIMAKMGYKEGQGLGKEEQGINKALEVEKTSKTQGKIINGSDKKVEEGILSVTEMLKSPSNVLLLRNMVGPGEVDSDLEPETKDECSKYGEVNRCVIHEVQGYENDEDAVRIFIEFVRVESAIKALLDLNGRYFGGRIVKASFYSFARFKRGELE